MPGMPGIPGICDGMPGDGIPDGVVVPMVGCRIPGGIGGAPDATGMVIGPWPGTGAPTPRCGKPIGGLAIGICGGGVDGGGEPMFMRAWVIASRRSITPVLA
jgi:hypothetical protein